MRIWIEQTGGVTGHLGAEHEMGALAPEQQRAVQDLLAARPIAHLPHGNTPRYRLHVRHDDGAAEVLTVEEAAMPDCLLRLTLPA